MREAVRDVLRLWSHQQGREALILLIAVGLLAITAVLRLDWVGLF